MAFRLQCQVGISNQDQFYHIYKRLPNCIGEQAEGIDGGGTCAIPIEASDGSGRDVFELYLFDSGTDAREGGYEAFDQKLSLLGALIEKVSDEKEIQKFTLKVS